MQQIVKKKKKKLARTSQEKRMKRETETERDRREALKVVQCLCDEKKNRKNKKELLQQATRRDKAPKTPVAEQTHRGTTTVAQADQTSPGRTRPELT